MCRSAANSCSVGRRRNIDGGRWLRRDGTVFRRSVGSYRPTTDETQSKAAVSMRPDDRQLRRMMADRDTLRRLVTKLTDQALEDLHRRGAQVAGHDGYPAGSGEGGGSGPGRPTEMAALALVEGTTERDNVGRWIAEVAALLDMLAGVVLDVEGRLGLLAKAGSTERPNTVELCAECNEPAPKVKRLDGQPYHPSPCWMRVYRRTGRNRGFGEVVTG